MATSPGGVLGCGRGAIVGLRAKQGSATHYKERCPCGVCVTPGRNVSLHGLSDVLGLRLAGNVELL